MKTKISKRLIFICLINFFLIFSVILSLSFSQYINESKKLIQNSPITYFLKVSYEGINKYGVNSETSRIDIYSDYIEVTDRLPDGLRFDGFVESEDGTIGARNDEGEMCLGNVINGDNGLHYDEKTRTISFKVTELEAGCFLQIGIKTMVPTLPDGVSRMDFYNTAYGKEDGFSESSNTVHGYIGDDNATTYAVDYKLGELPEGFETLTQKLPSSLSYVAGAKVFIAPKIEVNGYDFSWETSDIDMSSISNDTFVMPAKKVTFTGVFRRKEHFTVTYEIASDNRDILTNLGYVVPITKEYSEGERVRLDSTIKVGMEFKGYRINNFVVKDSTGGVINLSDGTIFNMPNKDVIISISFEAIRYNVSYVFRLGNGELFNIDSLPNNVKELIQTKTYIPLEEVSIASLKDIQFSDYKYNGFSLVSDDDITWKSEDKFIMPKNDVTILVDLVNVNGFFSPTIKIEIINKKDNYKGGNNVNYKVTVKNNESYDISNVLITNQTNGEGKLIFLEKDGLLVNDNNVIINSIRANESFEFNINYVVSTSDLDEIYDEVNINSASAFNDYYFRKNDNSVARVSFNISQTFKLTVCNNVNKKNSDKVFQFHIYENNGKYDTWLNLKNDECKEINVNPGDYVVKEIVPQDFVLKSATINGSNYNSDSVFRVDDNYRIEFNNDYKRKGFFHSNHSVKNEIKYSKAEIGDKYCIGEGGEDIQCFNVINYNEKNGTYDLLAFYNLYVGNWCPKESECYPLSGDVHIGMQYGNWALGDKNGFPLNGAVKYLDIEKENYIGAYVERLNATYPNVNATGRMATNKDFKNLGCNDNDSSIGCRNLSDDKAWILNTTFWVLSSNPGMVYILGGDGFFGERTIEAQKDIYDRRGVRPVITVSAETLGTVFQKQ